VASVINNVQSGVSGLSGAVSLADQTDSQMMWSTQVESGVDADIVPQDTETSDGFTVVRHRRGEKRAPHDNLSPATGVVRAVPIPVPAPTATHDRKGKRLMVGAATNSGHIRAADVSQRKAVFCVDNVQ
jgi:hypothetical protein